MDQTYLHLREAADRYSVQYDRLRRAAYDGRLLTIRSEGRFLVRPAEVERFLSEAGRAPRIEALPRRDGAADARVIAVAIPKGGTGKTTTTLNLGVALSEQGQRVLVVDVDPQANLTIALGVDPASVRAKYWSRCSSSVVLATTKERGLLRGTHHLQGELPVGLGDRIRRPIPEQ